MVVAADKKRRYLRWAAALAHREQSSLRDVLEDQLFERGQASHTGHRLAGVSANGSSTNLQADNSEVMMEVWSQLLDLYDTCSTSLSSTDQAEVYTEMMYRLDSNPVTSYRNDFTGVQH